jgi:hypothetical protein
LTSETTALPGGKTLSIAQRDEAAAKVVAVRAALARLDSWTPGAEAVGDLGDALDGLGSVLDHSSDPDVNPQARVVDMVIRFWTNLDLAESELDRLGQAFGPLCDANLPKRPVVAIPTPPPSPDPAAVRRYAQCLYRQQRDIHSLDRALEDCENERPAGETRRDGCTVFIYYRYHGSLGYSEAETSAEIAQQCAGY